MLRKRLQNRIAESRFALPATALYGLVVWLADGLVNRGLWLPFALMVVTAYLMVELNNQNALMRIYSRMVSCSFLVLSVTATFLFDQSASAMVGLCYAATYLLLFRAYQDKQAAGWTFFAFLFLGIASLFFVQVLYYVPILWILFGTKVMGLSWRTFWASVIGLVLPYWFYGGYAAYTGTFTVFQKHFSEIIDFEGMLSPQGISSRQLFTFLFIALLAFTGMAHFWRNSYKDKIRTRMLYEIFITVDMVTMVFILLIPRQINMLLPVMIVNTAPLIGHFIALTHTRTTNIAFCIISITALALTVYNLWGPLLIF